MVVRAPFSGVAISKDAQPGEMVSPVSAGGGFTRTGICTIVDMSSLEIEVDVNESYINRVQAGQQVTAVLDAYPRLADSRARHHDDPVGGSAEGDGEGAHRLRRARPADPAGHGRQGLVPARGRGASAPAAAAAAGDAGAEGRGRGPTAGARSCSSSRATASNGAPCNGRRRERRPRRRAVGLRPGERVVVSPPELWRRRKVRRGTRSKSRSDHADALVTVRNVHKDLHARQRAHRRAPGREPRHSAGRFPRADGPVRLRQDDAAQPDRRAGYAQRAARSTSAAIASTGSPADALSRGGRSHIGFVFQLYNLLPVLTAARNVELPLLLTKLGEGRPHASAWQVALSVVGLGDRARTTTRGSSRAARNSASASPARSSPTRRCCSATSRRATSIASPGDEILDLLETLNREHGKTIVMVTHDPHAADARAAHAAPRQGHAGVGGSRHEVPAPRLAEPASGGRSARSSRSPRSSSRSCCSAS